MVGSEEVGLEMDSSYVEYAAYESFLLLVERDTTGGFYVGVFDIEVIWCWRYQQRAQ